MTMGRAIDEEREDANLYICFLFLQCTLACIALLFLDVPFLFFLSISIAHVKSHFFVVTLLVQPVCLSILAFLLLYSWFLYVLAP